MSTEQDPTTFLSRVPTDGTTIGNGALREALGWEETRYLAVKEALVANGSLVKGQGRGGTVRRATAASPAPAAPATPAPTPPPLAPPAKPQAAVPPAPRPPAPQAKPADQSLSAFIWSVADLLRGDYKQSDYAKVILPFTVLRRLDCVLEPTKEAVLATTDPNLVLNLRAKLDAAGHYDDNEVERVVAVELNPKSRQGDLIAALEPVADRLIRQYKAAQEALQIAKAKNDKPGAKAANETLEALHLFKNDLGAFVRAYTFLSQIFDYGNTVIEKRSIFYKRLLPLLEFGREREGIDLSQVVMTHHHLKNQGKQTLSLNEGEAPKLVPMTESGGGQVQEKQSALLAELIEKVNSLFEGELTDDDKLVYVTALSKESCWNRSSCASRLRTIPRSSLPTRRTSRRNCSMRS